jgi:hypothetical protein
MAKWRVGLIAKVGVRGELRTSRTAWGGFRYGSALERQRAARTSILEAFVAGFMGYDDGIEPRGGSRI